MRPLYSAVVALLLLVGCGGGDYMPPPAVALRSDLWFAYYLTFDNQAEETADHVTMVHESGWFGVDATIASMRAHGKPVMLDLSASVYQGSKVQPDPYRRAAAEFQALKDAGVLHQVVALYPIDEPEIHGIDDAAVTWVNGEIRRAASAFPELAGVRLAVIYTSKNVLPGFDSYDWIGMDDYDMGAGLLVSHEWMAIMDRLQPHQGAFLVPGGGDPWRQDPEAFRRYAHSTPKVVGIMPFMWSPRRGQGDAPGIGANGLASVYRAVGREISRQ
jgi:hypothetical protein